MTIGKGRHPRIDWFPINIAFTVLTGLPQDCISPGKKREQNAAQSERVCHRAAKTGRVVTVLWVANPR